MIRDYESLARKVVKWNKTHSIKLELYRTYNNSFKCWGNSKGYKYSLYTNEGDLIAQGQLKTVIEDICCNKYYSKLLIL
ncbi:hypothetical protein [Fusobacterium phage Fnu1]|uniref:Uncharacterized protein n=1 Tax=Fusobacterium phage Fnu1 TaxID=2530024 RepID=A0A481W5Q7_9CAUD|nr:hypothetical protein KMD24_gp043 [Fusobacterium phage Fnu1]QBJ04207.1 hypothetical protein [Fusobacterium phage Fnu1]